MPGFRSSGVPVNPESSAIEGFFHRHKGVLLLSAESPQSRYAHDPAEKDVAGFDTTFAFNQVRLTLSVRQEKTKVLVDMVFENGKGTELKLEEVDLLDLTPSLSGPPELQPADYLLKEFERFGVLYQKKDRRFSLKAIPSSSPAVEQVVDRAYQVGLYNNCLEAGKWEIILNSRYYQDFDKTHASTKQYNRYRILAHTWFQMDDGLYRLLLQRKNPAMTINPFTGYTSLSQQGEKIAVPFQNMRNIKRRVRSRVLELGFQSKRELFELDEEEHYKYLYGLVLNRDQFHTYDDVLRQPIAMAKFTDGGYYRPEDAVSFDYAWMRGLNHIDIHIVEAPGPERFVEIRVGGVDSPYDVVLGNFDLGRLNPNKLVSLAFGFDALPKARLTRQTPYNTSYILGPEGQGIRPYLLVADKKTGQWVNNQNLGLEQIFIGWQSIAKDALVLYLVSYERMIPVWMGRLGIEDPAREKDGIQNAEYKPGDLERYPSPDLPQVRKNREISRTLSVSTPPLSDTVILDFEFLQHDDFRLAAHGYTYDEKGFTFISGGLLSAHPFRTVGTRGQTFSGSTALINGSHTGVTYLTKRNETMAEKLDLEGNLFGILSMELSRFTSAKEAHITFVGVKRDSSTVSTTFKLDGKKGPQKVEFGPEFQEVSTVRWISNSTQFDNITLRSRPF